MKEAKITAAHSGFAKIVNLNMHQVMQDFFGSCHHLSMPKTLSYKMKIH